jgi:hypothetical protein
MAAPQVDGMELITVLVAAAQIDGAAAGVPDAANESAGGTAASDASLAPERTSSTTSQAAHEVSTPLPPCAPPLSCPSRSHIKCS